MLLGGRDFFIYIKGINLEFVKNTFGNLLAGVLVYLYRDKL